MLCWLVNIWLLKSCFEKNWSHGHKKVPSGIRKNNESYLHNIIICSIITSGRKWYLSQLSQAHNQTRNFIHQTHFLDRIIHVCPLPKVDPIFIVLLFRFVNNCNIISEHNDFRIVAHWSASNEWEIAKFLAQGPAAGIAFEVSYINRVDSGIITHYYIRELMK